MLALNPWHFDSRFPSAQYINLVITFRNKKLAWNVHDFDQSTYGRLNQASTAMHVFKDPNNAVPTIQNSIATWLFFLLTQWAFLCQSLLWLINVQVAFVVVVRSNSHCSKIVCSKTPIAARKINVLTVLVSLVHLGLDCGDSLLEFEWFALTAESEWLHVLQSLECSL